MMRIRTRITEMARARGLTARQVARRAGLYPSNLSAMDAGRRSVSLRMLARVARVIGCGVGELLDESWVPEQPVFRSQALTRALEARAASVPAGAERGWVHAAMLAWRRHAGFHRAAA